MNREPIDLRTIFESIDRPWRPRVLAMLNDHVVQAAKATGEFAWHDHETDELFLVIAGVVTIQLRDGEDITEVVLRPGQLFVVPRETKHRPIVEDGEASLILIDVKGTVNTGKAGGPLTAPTDDSLLHT